MTKLLIATPAYGGNVCSDYTESLLHTCILLSHFNIQFQLKFINNQIVTRARNMLCSIFMDDNTFTHMIFIDADIVWKPEDVILLLQHDLECVIGIYPNKNYYWVDNKIRTNASSCLSHNNSNNNNKEFLVRVEKAATGFMLLKKSALHRIKNEVGSFFLPDDCGKNIKLYNYFDCNIVDNDYLTEDYYFSYLFNKKGGIIYADTRIKLKHIGPHQYGSLVN